MTTRTYSTKNDGDLILAAHIDQVQTDLTALSQISAKGSLVVGGTAGVETELPVGANTQVIIADSAQTAGVKWGYPGGTSAKGDLAVNTGSALAALSVGLDGQTLIADSTATNGITYTTASTLYAQREMQVLANPGAATLTTVGFAAAPTVTGTPTSSDDANGPMNLYTSGSVSGNVAGLNSAATVCRRDWSPEFVVRMETGAAITNVRLWFGLFSTVPTGSATGNTGHLAAFRYDTGVDGTAFWRTATDSGTNSPTVTTTAQSIATGTAYRLRMKLQASQVLFYINDVLVATHTTTLPTATTMLSYYATVTTLTTAAATFKASRLALAHI